MVVGAEAPSVTMEKCCIVLFDSKVRRHCLNSSGANSFASLVFSFQITRCLTAWDWREVILNSDST